MTFGLIDSHADAVFFAVIATELSCLSMPRAVRGHCSYRVCGAPALRDPIGSGANTYMAKSAPNTIKKKPAAASRFSRTRKNDSYRPFPVLFFFF
jgi:hypothetical protein